VCHFIARCYAVARCLSVCPSVSLSRTRRYCVETAERIIGRHFFTIGYHTILVFAHQTLWQYSNGGVECRGMKKSRFSTGFISEIVQDDLQWPQGCSIIWRWISETVPDIHSCNEILKGTYTRPTHRCHFKWPWIQWHEAPCDLSASCRYRFLLQYFQVIWRWRMPIPWNLG